jgi:hypothetical protein
VAQQFDVDATGRAACSLDAHMDHIFSRETTVPEYLRLKDPSITVPLLPSTALPIHTSLHAGGTDGQARAGVPLPASDRVEATEVAHRPGCSLFSHMELIFELYVRVPAVRHMSNVHHDVDPPSLFCHSRVCARTDRVSVRVSAPAPVRVLPICGRAVRRDYPIRRRFRPIVTIGLVMRR